jgi:hypothetical protein
MNPLACLADHAPVPLKGDAKLPLLWHVLKAFQCVGNLAVAKEWLEHEGIALGHDLGNLLLHALIELRFGDAHP